MQQFTLEEVTSALQNLHVSPDVIEGVAKHLRAIDEERAETRKKISALAPLEINDDHDSMLEHAENLTSFRALRTEVRALQTGVNALHDAQLEGLSNSLLPAAEELVADIRTVLNSGLTGNYGVLAQRNLFADLLGIIHHAKSSLRSSDAHSSALSDFTTLEQEINPLYAASLKADTHVPRIQPGNWTQYRKRNA